MDPLLQGPQYEPRPDVHSTGVGEAALALECEFFKVPVTYGHELGLSDRRCRELFFQGAWDLDMPRCLRQTL